MGDKHSRTLCCVHFRGTNGGLCEGGNDVSGSIKYRKFLSRWGTVSVWGRTLLHGGIHLFFRSPGLQSSWMWNHVYWRIAKESLCLFGLLYPQFGVIATFQNFFTFLSPWCSIHLYFRRFHCRTSVHKSCSLQRSALFSYKHTICRTSTLMFTKPINCMCFLYSNISFCLCPSHYF